MTQEQASFGEYWAYDQMYYLNELFNEGYINKATILQQRPLAALRTSKGFILANLEHNNTSLEIFPTTVTEHDAQPILTVALVATNKYFAAVPDYAAFETISRQSKRRANDADIIFLGAFDPALNLTLLELYWHKHIHYSQAIQRVLKSNPIFKQMSELNSLW